MGFNVTELQGSNVAAIIAALRALGIPELVTTSQAGLLAPDTEAIEAGFIKTATGNNKGLMSKEMAALLESPEAIVFIAGKALTRTAGFHNSLYRGKYLGNSVTSAQWTQINAGTFDDLFIGDYWTIGGISWRIAAFDYWLRSGDTECTTHHVVIVPDDNLLSGGLNSSGSTTGAYVGSDFYTGNNGNTAKSEMMSTINSAFGSRHILEHREYLKNATTNGYESGGAWYDSTAELMTERMLYGCDIFHNATHGANLPNFSSIDKTQLPLFRMDQSRIVIRAGYWLRDVVSATDFAHMNSIGYVNYDRVSRTYGIRPAFGIRG